MREFLLFIKYPYTAGVIATIWLGSAVLMALNRDLPTINMIIINMFVTVIIAFIGFGGKEKN